MTRKRLSILVLIAMASVALVGPLAAFGEAEAADETWTLPRTAAGKPNLQGVWANNNATPLQRPPDWAGRERLTDEELAALVVAAGQVSNAGADALFGDQLVLAAIARTKAESYDPSTGNYNQFWVAEREFSHRTSLIVNPEDGVLPAMTEEANERLCKATKYALEHPADTWLDRPLSERCVTYGVPFIGAGYNSYFQIIQSDDHVVVLMEMIHDARVIPISSKPHLDDAIRQWHGDSRAHWDGDTLVVETTNYSKKSDFMGARQNLRLEERFTLTGAGQLDYQVTIEDDTTWTAPWTASIPMRAKGEHIFEYACHEGNYGMTGILAGHRAEEAKGKESLPDPAGFRYANLVCDELPAPAGGD